MHKESIKIVDNADTAVLFIHGIIGTPEHFSDFVNLVPADMSFCNMLLDGHGKGVSDFSKTSMAKWKKQVSDKINELEKTHKNIIIVAHSMGTLFAITEAINRKQTVKKLFLIASPLKLFIKPSMFINAAKVYFNKVRDDDKHAASAKRAYGIKDSKNIFKYLGWIPRYLELFSEIKSVRKLVTELSTPCVVFQSRFDEMVSFKAVKILLKNNNMKVHILENSTHYYYNEQDYALLLESFKNYIA